MYRVALTYHPDVGTFRGKRGAWRVAACFPTPAPEPVVSGYMPKELYLATHHKYRKGTFVNPTKILKEYQSTKRSNTQ